MPSRSNDKKTIESWFLAAARNAGVPVPFGEVRGEEPDFRFRTASGALGIELSEVLRPPTSNHGISPVAEEAFHREIIEIAQADYYAVPNAIPARVGVYFTKIRGKKRSKRELAGALAMFVLTNVHHAMPVACFIRDQAPDGFDSVVIVAESNTGDWWSGEFGGVTVSDIRPQVEARIAAKDCLVETYRSNLPDGAKLWLLLHTGVTVARSMPIPHGIEDWRIPFRFDRVFWFAALEGQFVDIRNK